MPITESNIGRPFSEISLRFSDPHLRSDLDRTFRDNEPTAAEICTDDDRWYLRQIVPQNSPQTGTGGVIITFTDVTQIRQTAEQLRTRERQQAALALLGQQALREIDIDKLLQSAVRSIRKVLGVDYCKVLELLPDGEQLLLRAGVGWKRGLAGKATVPAGSDSQAGYTLQSGSPVVVESLAEEARFYGPQLLFDHKVVSGMSVSIPGRDGPYGVLGVHSRRKMHFTVDDVNFLQAIAHVLSAAVVRRGIEQGWSESERRLRLALSVGGMGTWEWDHETDEAFWGDDLNRVFGYPHGTEPKAELFFDRVHRDDLPRLNELLDRVVDEGIDYWSEFRFIKPDGTECWLAGMGGLLDVGSGKSTRLAGVNFDITDRKRADQELKKLNETLETRVHERTVSLKLQQEVATIANDSVSIDEAIQATLDSVCEHMLWPIGHACLVAHDPPRRFQDPGLWSFSSRENRSVSRIASEHLEDDTGFGRMAEVARTAQPVWISDIARDRELKQSVGTAEHFKTVDVKSCMLFPAVSGKEVVAVLEFFSTETVEPNQQIATVMGHVGTQLGRVVERSRLQQQLIDAVWKKQRQFGQELHDTLAQEIAGIGMMSRNLQNLLENSGVAEHKFAAQIADMLYEAQQSVRRLSKGLFPVDVFAHGLAPALEELLSSVQDQNEVECRLHTDEEVEIEDHNIATHLFRIAQEAVHNAIKHSQCNRIDVRLGLNGDVVELAVRDDGIGLSQAPSDGQGIGTRLMRYRSDVIGGDLRIADNDGAGTTVTCKVDLSDRRTDSVGERRED